MTTRDGLSDRAESSNTSRPASARQNEVSFEALVEDLPLLVCSFLPGGEITYANPLYCEYFGKTREELVGTSFLLLVPEAERDEVWARVSAPTVEAPTQSHEHQVIAAGGEIRWHRWLNRTIFDAEGRPLAYHSVGGDITAQKRAEEELHRYEEIVSSTTDMLALVDRNCVYLAANKAYLEPFGKGPGEVLGHTIAEVFGDEFFNAVIRPWSDRCLAGEQIQFRDWFEFPVGGRKCLDVEYSPYLGPDGDVTGFVVSARDVTRRTSEAEALELLSVAIDQVADSIIITDTEGTIQYVNPSYERNTGYSTAEAIGQNARILESGEHDDAFYKDMWDTLRSGKPWSGRFVNRKKDGELYTEEAVISPVRDASGRTLNYVSVARDITLELEAEREQTLLEAQYQRAQKLESLGRLVGGVAHDMNNLLTPILGYAEILQSDLSLGDRRRESVEEILRAGLGAKDLVRRLLAFSRQQAFEYRPLNMNEVVVGFEKLLRRTIREDIEIEIVPSPDISSVMADVGQIEQVIMNLVVNAQDAMPEGGRLTFETTMVDLDEDDAACQTEVEPGRYVMLAVSDTGCGIDEAAREHLFEPFYSTKGELGTGLGLATVHGIVKQHGGNVGVDSEPGTGSTFRVYLPVSAEEVVDEQAAEEAETESGGSETILLAEDNEQVRQLVRGVLERQGYTVLAAEDGAQALTLLTSHDRAVQLLVTDLVMPGMSGVELFTRAKEQLPGLKVLYMSGYTDEAVHQDASDDGLSFIQKPFAVQALTARVREVLAQV